MTTTAKDSTYLDRAIARVTKMLADKKDIWAAGCPTFDNFDIHEGFGLTSIQFALAMCNLKLNRLKNLWRAQPNTDNPLKPGAFFEDSPDAEDTLIDLASYGMLGLGLLYRQRDRNNTAKQPFFPPDYTAQQRAAQDTATSYDDGFGIMKKMTDAYIKTPEGQSEIEAYAREIMAGGALTPSTEFPEPSAFEGQVGVKSLAHQIVSDGCGRTPNGREEIAKLAAELMGVASCPPRPSALDKPWTV